MCVDSMAAGNSAVVLCGTPCHSHLALSCHTSDAHGLDALVHSSQAAHTGHHSRMVGLLGYTLLLVEVSRPDTNCGNSALSPRSCLMIGADYIMQTSMFWRIMRGIIGIIRRCMLQLKAMAYLPMGAVSRNIAMVKGR